LRENRAVTVLAEIEAELDRGLDLHREGKTESALKIYERVIEDATRESSAQATTLAAVAWQAKCQVFMDAKRWSEALDASSVFLESSDRNGEFRVRWAIAYVRLVFSRAIANLSLASTGEIGEFAEAELDALVDWLRNQPEPAFAPELARRLRLKVHWHARDEDALGALDELVAVLTRIKDPELVREVADALLRSMPLLFAPNRDDRECATEVLEESAVFEPEILFSGELLRRMARLARSLNGLADLLGGQSQRSSSSAALLRAAMLLHVCMALARLSQEDGADHVFRQAARLDQAALDACDRIAADAVTNATETNGDSGPDLVAIAVLKARIHSANGRTQIAVAALEDLCSAHEDDSSPWIKAVLEEVEDLREDLLAEPELPPPVPPASPHQTSSSSARVVWRRGSN
jgi:tetratricopeptide (TPR) repeat protein